MGSRRRTMLWQPLLLLPLLAAAGPAGLPAPGTAMSPGDGPTTPPAPRVLFDTSARLDLALRNATLVLAP